MPEVSRGHQLKKLPKFDFKSRPRNQHYLHEVVIIRRPLFVPISKRRIRCAGLLRVGRLQHCRKVPLQLDSERVRVWSKDDGIDEPAQRYSGLCTAFLVLQRERESGDFFAL